MSVPPLLLVTGGLGDIGIAIARKFIKHGWRVALNDRLLQAAGEERLTVLFEESDPVRYFSADNTERESVETMVAQVGSLLGMPQVTAINAGIVEPQPFLEMTAASWQQHLDCNLTGAFHIAQTVARTLIANSVGGAILVNSSWVQDIPSRNIGAYCVSKAGLKMLARQMALELAACNIRVNLVAPGIVEAGLSAQMFRDGQADRAPFEQAIPLHRIQSAAEVADAFWLLAQPEAAYLTGATLLTDGGMSLYNWQEL